MPKGDVSVYPKHITDTRQNPFTVSGGQSCFTSQSCMKPSSGVIDRVLPSFPSFDPNPFSALKPNKEIACTHFLGVCIRQYFKY
jgi:hypothetical protein